MYRWISFIGGNIREIPPRPLPTYCEQIGVHLRVNRTHDNWSEAVMRWARRNAVLAGYEVTSYGTFTAPDAVLMKGECRKAANRTSAIQNEEAK